jgi:exopolysaccharide biosynthesis polyprenyl glycosylphosphotransferase
MMMSRRFEIPVLMVTDVLTMCVAWTLYYLFRVRSGLLIVSAEPDFVLPMIVVTLFWVLLFFVVGLYRPWYAASRFDEVALLFKTLVLGSIILFFAVFIDDEGTPPGTNSRLLIAVYWGFTFVSVVSGRMLLRSIQRQLLIAGIGAHNTVIVGSQARSRELFEEVSKYPGLGYRVLGAVRLEKPERKKARSRENELKILGALDDLAPIIKRHEVREVLIALDSKDHNRLLDIVARCVGHPVGLKIVPDLYDIISGQARTNQIYGFPLIEISPLHMPPWEEAAKRLLDLGVSALVLILGTPVWLIIAGAIKLDSHGPVLYKQERVGKDGAHFNIIKFRSMVSDAERAGPQWAGKRDPRVTRVGWILRKLHLDEFPQMWNVLAGHMSLVGPRPERPVFVEKLSREIPLYPRRLKVRPGVTGWAQVKHVYDESIEDVRKKVQYDLFYIENMSLRMDLKILFNTVSHMLLGKGR